MFLREQIFAICLLCDTNEFFTKESRHSDNKSNVAKQKQFERKRFVRLVTQIVLFVLCTEGAEIGFQRIDSAMIHCMDIQMEVGKITVLGK